jgi:hypothetical protein
MRYFFNFWSKRGLVVDTEGTELRDGDAAREEGRISARELMGLDRGRRSRNIRAAALRSATLPGD